MTARFLGRVAVGHLVTNLATIVAGAGETPMLSAAAAGSAATTATVELLFWWDDRLLDGPRILDNFL